MVDLASLAASLRDNEAFQEALTRNRNDALEGLARTPATDTEAIRDHQAMIRTIDNIRSSLEQFIRSGRPPKASGIA